MTQKSKELSPRKLVLLLALLISVMPLSTDVYLPAIPEIALSLAANIHRVEQSLSTFILGVAIGQLLGGSLSDLKGRKRIALIGLIIHILASSLIIFAQNAEQLLWLRWLQALGGGMAAVTVGAVVRDYFTGQEAAKMFATIGIIMMAAPLMAPMIGAVIQGFGGWRAIFIFLVLYALLVWVLLFYFMPTQHREKKPLGKKIVIDIYQNFHAVFQQPQALGFMFFQAFSFSSMFVFLTESSFVYMNLYQLTPHQYAWAFGANIIAMMFFNRITAYRLKTTPAKNILLSGIAVQFGCNLLLCILAWSMALPPFIAILILIMCSVGTQGLVVSNTQACFMSYYQKVGGSANAILGCVQFLIAAIVGWMTTLLHNGSLVVMPSMMLLATSCGAILLWLFSHQVWSHTSLKKG